MKPKIFRTIASGSFVLALLLNAGWQAQAQDTKAPYPSAAPLDQYLMERNAEVAMARSAAPESISRDAEVELVLAARSKTEMAEDIKTAFDKKELPALESGAMCYMMFTRFYLRSGS
jgi:hypothetical protein